MNKQVNHFLKHFDLNSYRDAFKALEKTNETNEVKFSLAEITNYGGILMVAIDGTEFQATKKKIRHSDYMALLKGTYWGE